MGKSAGLHAPARAAGNWAGFLAYLAKSLPPEPLNPDEST
jgi:hypothetical protein